MLYKNSTTGRLEFALGPEMIRGMNGHCIARVNQTHIFLGGGNTRYPYLFNEYTSEFVELKQLIHNRFRPACAVVQNHTLNKG